MQADSFENDSMGAVEQGPTSVGARQDRSLVTVQMEMARSFQEHGQRIRYKKGEFILLEFTAKDTVANVPTRTF
jgi:hypothetical protein